MLKSTLRSPHALILVTRGGGGQYWSHNVERMMGDKIPLC